MGTSIHDRLMAMSDAAAALSARPAPRIASLPEDDGLEIIGLVAQAQDGSKDAFGQLYRIYYPRIYRLTQYLLQGKGEDAAAETFIRAWKALPRYKDRGAPFIAWLYTIARNVARDELRAQRRVEPRADLAPLASQSLSQDDHLALMSAVRALPEGQRQIIEMKYLLGMTNPEVSKVLGKSVGAVNAQQWRALKTLEEMLEQS